jgi:glycosyltransferase involved in cell wall biosynthesis
VEGNIDYVYRCLISIWEASPDVSYEIIFVHDGESDEVSVALAEMLTIEVIRRVVPALPKAISSSRGKFIHFLQNDVEVTKGWLDALVASYEDYPNAGIVGSMLLRTDGRFKQGQAGEVLVPDATELGSGSIDDPDRPEYNYARIIDGCSPESILIDKEAFGWAHAFEGKVDCTYLDAISLISEINRVKRDSIFQPWSKVVHHGEIAMNQRRAHACIDTAGVGKSDLKNSRILVIDAVTPTPDRDAGSVTSFYYMQLFIELGYDVTFIPADNFLRMEKYTENLQRIGVHCLYYPYWTSVESFLDQKGTDFDFVLLYRVEFAATYVDLVREKCPSAKIIFDTVDLHFLREMRQAEHENSRQLKMTAQQTREREIGVMLKADETIVLSEIEKNLLDDEDSLKDSTITTIPLILDIPGRNNPFSKRKDILFIGGYGHPPNVDAVLYFANSIWPLIHQSHPDIKFYVLGSNPSTEVKALNHDGIEIVGFVEELSDYFDSIRLSVVPLRYGAGIKGKIGSSLSYGVPVVSTAVGVEGMGIGEEGVLIAENEQTFSAALVKLYFDEDYWTKMSNLGLDFVDKNYSLAAGKKRLGQMLSRLKSGEEC